MNTSTPTAQPRWPFPAKSCVSDQGSEVASPAHPAPPYEATFPRDVTAPAADNEPWWVIHPSQELTPSARSH